jgi:outer membrane receptor for ferrienterochelin and colicin
MRMLLTTTAALAIATAANAQDAASQASTAQPSQSVAAAQGVIVYKADFFAAAQPNTAMDMINRLPGFSFNGGDNVRGFAGAVGNVFLDGAPPASKSDPLSELLRRIPASTVERIEVIRGGAPGVDMHGQAVVANVIRKKDAGGTLMFAVADQWYDDGRTAPAARLEGSRRWDGKSVEGGVLIYKFVDDGAGEGPRVRRDASGNLLERAFQDQTAGGKGIQLKGAGDTPLWGGDFRANGALKIERYDFDYLDTGGLVDSVDVDRQDEHSGEIGLNYEHALGPRTKVEALAIQRLKRTEYSSAFAQPGFDALFTEDDDSGESIARATVRFAWSDKLSFNWGGEGAFNFLESAVTYSENGSPVALPSANVRVEEKRGEAFAEATWKLRPTLTLEAGARFETSTITETGDANLERSFFYPKPRVLLTWSPNEDNQVRLRFEREVGQLDFGDFVSSVAFSTATVDAGNPDLHPDQTWVSELAYERRFWGKGAAVITVRHKSITDAIDRVPIFLDTDGDGIADISDPDDDNDGIPDGLDPDDGPDVFDAPGNIGSATVDQLDLNLTVPLDKLGVKGGLIRGQGTWSSSEVDDPTTHATRRLSRLQPFTGELHFSQDLPARKALWGADFFVGNKQTFYRFDEITTQKVGSWLTLFAEYKPQPNLSLRVEAHNLLSRPVTRIREVYDGPRGVSPLQFREDRPLEFGPFIYFRLRKTWG